MKIDVSFAALTHTGHSCNTIPYGAAVVAAYALKTFGDKIDAKVFKYVTGFTQYLNNKIPEVACFSNYLWNFNLSCQVARRIKAASPNTVIIVGGPNYPIDITEQKTFLLNHLEIDFYIAGDGEEAIVALFDKLFEYDFDVNKLKKNQLEIVGCHYATNNQIVRGAFPSPLKNLDEIPSPYLIGLCDDLLSEDLIPLVQTTRGCPFSCSFCQQGSKSFNSISRFSPERIREEIEYIANRTEVPNLMLADSNFGMYKEDIKICRIIAEIQEKYNYPRYFQGIEGKTHKDRVIEAATIIKGAYLSAAVQSTDKLVLDNIKRRNVPQDQIIEISKHSEALGSTSLSEIILCLPGDTKEAHFKSILDIIDAGIGVVRSHQLIMLPGSEISTNESRQQYGMQTGFRVAPKTTKWYCLFGEEFNACETEEICIANDTMTFDDYLECRLFNLTIEIFYNDSIILELIKFLKLCDIPTSLFIRELHTYLRSSSNKLSDVYDAFLRETKEVWGSKGELEEFLRQRGVIDRYISGELGNNEQLVYRAISIFKHMDDLHEIAFYVAKKLMFEREKLDEEYSFYMKELCEFSVLRKRDILSMETVTEKVFHYDFVKLEECNFNDYPINYYCPEGLKIKFAHTNSQKELFSKYIKLYGLTNYGLGNILGNAAQVNSLYCEVRVVD